MSHTREMLTAVPGADRYGAAELAAAIDACLDASQACTSCADASLAEPELPALRECIALCEECGDVCVATALTLSRTAHSNHVVVHRILQACVGACTASADECARHADHHRHCEICARVCRACLAACRGLLDVEAFEELQKLAGG